MKKETQKLLVLSLLMVLAISMVSSVVSAATFSENFNNAVDWIEVELSPVLGRILGTAGNGGDLLTQVLAFLLVMFIIYGVLGTVGIFGEKTWINMAVGAIIALIGIRFMPGAVLNEMTAPSSAFVAILVLGLPFILLGILLEKSDLNSYIRRAVWAGFAVLILVLWIYNETNPDFNGVWWIYPLIAAGCILAFWFDGTLQKFMRKARAARTIEGGKTSEIRAIQNDIRDAQRRLKDTKLSQQERTEISNDIKALRTSLNTLLASTG